MVGVLVGCGLKFDERCRAKGFSYFLPRRPKRPCPLVVPAMTATFLDENLPDGTRLRPGTKFIKYWKMRNTGTISWNADTKVKNSTLIQPTFSDEDFAKFTIILCWIVSISTTFD